MKQLTILFYGALFLLFSNTNAQEVRFSKYDTFLRKYVSDKGEVNYDAIKKNKSDLDVVVALFDKAKPKSSWSKNQKLAYWMNAYNVYTIQLVIENYPTKSIKNIAGGKPWDKKFITQNGKKISLNHIEHEILRQMGDARIHFGIVCASISCPKLSNKAFTEANVQSELEKLTKGFINDSSRNTISAKKVKISQIFNWFKADFNGVIPFLNKYSNTKINKNAKISYASYDWNLNQ